MQTKKSRSHHDASGCKESRIDIPNLRNVGVGTRFLVFLEIARHPDGLTVGSICEKCGDHKRSSWYHINHLLEQAYISCDYQKHNGKVEAIFRVTPYGIDVIQKEMRSVCEIVSHIKKEMITDATGARKPANG